MYQKIFFVIIIIFAFTNCAKEKEISNKPPDEKEAIKIYKDAMEAMNKGQYYFAAQKFTEAENIMPVIEQSA